jgi:hypothetical protein
VTSLWRALSRIPSTAFVAAMILVALPCRLLLSDDAMIGVAFASFGAFIAYCVARPSRGGDVFGIGVMPSCVSAIAGDIVDVPRAAIGVPLLAVAFVLLWQIDRETRRGTPVAA